MIPLRDTAQSKSYPVTNTALIAVNVIVFLIQSGQGADLERFIYVYGLVPARYTVPQISDYFTWSQQVFSFVSFMFLHGGFWHLLGNMWSLYIFGDNVEDHLGPLRYLLFYLLCGMASGLAHMFLNQVSNAPTIGASGAIAGVMGAYFLLYPHAKILTLVPIIIIPFFFEIPAYFFLGLWFLMQFLSAAGSLGQSSGIAWWAHIGGFVFGILALKIMLLLPRTGMTRKVQAPIRKKRSHHLQLVHADGHQSDLHLYGKLTITPFEALLGTKKMISVPWGFKKRIFRVVVPAGIKEGATLRLRGLGRRQADGQAGDLYLKVGFAQKASS